MARKLSNAQLEVLRYHHYITHVYDMFLGVDDYSGNRGDHVNRRTIESLIERGYYEVANERKNVTEYRITDAGRAAIEQPTAATTADSAVTPDMREVLKQGADNYLYDRATATDLWHADHIKIDAALAQQLVKLGYFEIVDSAYENVDCWTTSNDGSNWLWEHEEVFMAERSNRIAAENGDIDDEADDSAAVEADDEITAANENEFCNCYTCRELVRMEYAIPYDDFGNYECQRCASEATDDDQDDELDAVEADEITVAEFATMQGATVKHEGRLATAAEQVPATSTYLLSNDYASWPANEDELVQLVPTEDTDDDQDTELDELDLTDDVQPTVKPVCACCVTNDATTDDGLCDNCAAFVGGLQAAHQQRLDMVKYERDQMERWLETAYAEIETLKGQEHDTTD